MDLLLISSLSSLLTTFLSHPTFCGRGRLTRRSLVCSPLLVSMDTKTEFLFCGHLSRSAQVRGPMRDPG